MKLQAPVPDPTCFVPLPASKTPIAGSAFLEKVVSWRVAGAFRLSDI